MVVTVADAITEEFPQHFRARDRETIGQALEIARKAHRGQQRADGTPYVDHPIAVATILIEWKADAETVVAGLLHDALEDAGTLESTIRATFGPTTFAIIDGVTKFNEVDFPGSQSLDRKIETLRKLFEVMRSDVRAAVVKLADRLHNVRTLEGLSEDRRVRFAKETLDVYYKIAYHLGMNDVRREFSERCFPLLYPQETAMLRERRSTENTSFGNALREFEEELRKHDGGKALLTLRREQRSFVSLREHIVRQREEKPAFGVVAVGRDREACYNLLRIIHTLYHPLPGTFRDYIAVPTERAHQSIHTTVLGPKQQILPFRIRTEGMDAQEKQGILLTCFGGRKDVPGFSWLKRSEHLDLATRKSSEAFWQALQSDIFQETVSITVDGETLSIARGATALDAAYARHGEDASRILSILVNGADMSPGTTLKRDDVVNLKLDEHPHVVLSWLDDTTTQYSRILIARSLKQRDRHEKIAIGHRLVQKELDHFQRGFIGGLTKAQQRRVAEHFQRGSFEDVLAMVGEGVLRARDIVFALFPEKRRFFLPTDTTANRRYPFRIRIAGGEEEESSILPQIATLAHIHDAELWGTRAHPPRWYRTFNLTMRGAAKDRMHFADFLAAVERLREVSHVRTLLSTPQLVFLLLGMGLGFSVILLDILFLPSYEELPYVPGLFESIVPTIPILAVNYAMLRLLTHYFALLRSDRWYIGLGFLMNFAGLTLLIFRSSMTGGEVTILPLMAVFIFSMFVLGYHFFKSEALFTQIDRRALHPPTTEEWRARLRQKVLGYTIRLCAVVMWGFQPLLLKYTPANTVHPFTQLYLMSLGATLTTIFLVLLRKGISPLRSPDLRIPWNFYLPGIIIGEALFLYFISASLLFTTSTNFALLSNFSPVAALLIAALFWRHSIHYLRDPKHMLQIFFIFLMGSTGGSLIIYHSAQLANTRTIIGDLLALSAMVADVLTITSQIRYIKLTPKAPSLSLNTYMFGPTTLALTPVILFLYLTGSDAVASLTYIPILCSLGVGVMLAAGMVCNFEAFRRIDGFIAFLMFNLSILINFVAEVFFLKTIIPTWALVLGGTIIIGSTILAELVNSRCEKQGL